jgi:hypothetical protein
MREDDPLEAWLDLSEMMEDGALRSRFHEDARRSLDKLEALVGSPPGAKVNYYDARPGALGRYSSSRLRPEQCERVSRLYYQMWQRGGNGLAYAQEQLLDALGMARDPASIPFWVALLDLTKPRDQFTTRRRTFALAALALLAIRDENAEALAALEAALSHRHEQVRAQAAFYCGAVYRIAQKLPPDTAHDALLACAMRDPTFAPRFQAREALRRLGMPAPLDLPGGAYHFQVRIAHDRRGPSRTLALHSDSTLDHLAFAILRAFAWDNDHLFAFYMNNQRFDERYEIRCPEFDPDGFETLEWQGEEAADLVAMDGEYEDESDEDEDDDEGDDGDEDESPDIELYTSEVLLGSLGLILKHTFLLLFDFGDNHEFEVTVVAIEERAAAGEYPRLVASKGKAPPQYWFEDEDDEGESDEDDEDDEEDE